MNEEVDHIYSVQTPGTTVWLDKTTWLDLKGKARLITDHNIQVFAEVTSINGTEHAFFIDYATVFCHSTKTQREEIHEATGAFIEEIPHKEDWEK